ncbi:hypothetical protein ATANTOWER_003470 [Ataeniobius toweri]|uniref:Uncharacterized protein n=1 Tax=Ataeniobius toweri TaxID=208326 RepID=A0ABU7C092_9TELE|nr:hypothetical protein [Ataeniobius toweri]
MVKDNNSRGHSGCFQAMALFPVRFLTSGLSVFPDSWVKNLQDQGSSLQLPSLDKLLAGSFLTPRSTGPNHKQTLFTLQCALMQVPPPGTPHLHLTHHRLCFTGQDPRTSFKDSKTNLSWITYLLSHLWSCAPRLHISLSPWRDSHLFL